MVIDIDMVEGTEGKRRGEGGIPMDGMQGKLDTAAACKELNKGCLEGWATPSHLLPPPIAPAFS